MSKKILKGDEGTNLSTEPTKSPRPALVQGQCPDCGCPVARHNSVLKPAGGKNASLDLPVAHCGGCGTCWNTRGTDFVETVRAALKLENGQLTSEQKG